MKTVMFTQFLRPHGRQRPVTIDRTDEIGDKADALVSQGYRLEIEELNTGMISMTIHHPSKNDGEPIAHKLCSNGPSVPDAVDDLINTAIERIKTSSSDE